MNYNLSIQTETKHDVLVRTVDKSAARLGFSGDLLSTLFIEQDGKLELLVGLGDEALNVRQWQDLFANIAKTMAKHKIKAYDLDLSSILAVHGEQGAHYASQGLLLSAYSFSLKAQESETVDVNLLVADADTAAIEAVVNESQAVSEGILFARDLINLPSNHLHPRDMAARITDLVSPLGVECEVLEADTLKEKGINGLFLVGDSSENKPCLLVLRHLPLGPDHEKVGLVGKGVTFDSGGYSLKPAASMMAMKSDMAGGAAVAGTIYALAKNKVQTNVVAVIPLCENRVSDSSLVPGDVYTAYSGQTVEVLNTDAEGRLILADAVSYIQKDEGVSRIVDIATLTGAVGAALGNVAAGVVTNNHDWWAKVEAAGDVVGERYHVFPDFPEYHKMLDSSIADVKNIGDRSAGAITGGLFIGRFVEDRPWVHLDIAATSWTESPAYAYQSKGGTGSGLVTLYQLCVNLAKEA